MEGKSLLGNDCFLVKYEAVLIFKRIVPAFTPPQNIAVTDPEICPRNFISIGLSGSSKADGD